MEDAKSMTTDASSSKPTRRAKARKPAKKAKKPGADGKRQRTARPYPASSFKEALAIGRGIVEFGSGQKIRRLTLLEKMERSPNSSATKMAITNSNKYGITKGSYAADHLELTEPGKIVSDDAQPEHARRKAQFELSIGGITPFSLLYETYKGKRLPAKEVMKDTLREHKTDADDLDECVDTFIVNAKDADLLRTIGGAETIVGIEEVLEQLPRGAATSSGAVSAPPSAGRSATSAGTLASAQADWTKICFYITPIGEEGSDERKHADLFATSLVEPALVHLGLKLVRADEIGRPGMITSQVIEHLKKAQLAIADLSYLNPNVFWEMALRHACRLPTVQIIRKKDRIPYDVNQVRSVVIDTTDIYTLIPKLDTYQSEIATQAREALADPQSVGNPITIFYPDFFK